RDAEPRELGEQLGARRAGEEFGDAARRVDQRGGLGRAHLRAVQHAIDREIEAREAARDLLEATATEPGQLARAVVGFGGVGRAFGRDAVADDEELHVPRVYSG